MVSEEQSVWGLETKAITEKCRGKKQRSKEAKKRIPRGGRDIGEREEIEEGSGLGGREGLERPGRMEGGEGRSFFSSLECSFLRGGGKSSARGEKDL